MFVQKILLFVCMCVWGCRFDCLSVHEYVCVCVCVRVCVFYINALLK